MRCTNLHFDGLTDETINQGADFDALEGVKAYDADGNEVAFSVEPEEFDSCAVGEQTLVYKAMGKDNRLIPSMCIPKDSSGANLPLGCTLTLLKENRKITVLQADPPRFTMNDVTIPKNTTLDVLAGVSAVDDNGNPITDITYSGTLDKEVSGDIVSIDDGDERYPVKSLSVQLEPIQSGSGTPSPDNICPISGHTEVNTQRIGKNIWGGTQLRDDILAKVPNAVADDTNKTIRYDASSVTGKILFDKFKPNTQYTIILRGYNTNTSSQSENISIRYTDGTTQYTQGFVNGVSRTVTDASKSIEYIRGQWVTSVTYLYYDECGVFEGVLTADQFEPYQGTTYTTALGRTVYGGMLDVVSGELVVDRAMVDLSTLTWSGSSGIKLSTGIANVVKAPSANNVPANIVAEKYATSAVAPISANDGKIGIEATGTRGRIQCGSSETPSGMLCYELATPQTYQLDPQTISLLKGNNNVWSDGEVEMVYSVELPTDGEVSYPLEGEYEITYSASDKCGNIGEAIRHITVQ